MKKTYQDGQQYLFDEVEFFDQAEQPERGLPGRKLKPDRYSRDLLVPNTFQTGTRIDETELESFAELIRHKSQVL